ARRSERDTLETPYEVTAHTGRRRPWQQDRAGKEADMSVAADIGPRTGVGRRSRRRKLKLAPYLFISPFYLLFLAFGLLPIVFSLAVSLYDWRGTQQATFTGLSNYQVLFHDADFFAPLTNTVVVWLGSTVPMIFLALVFA